MDNESFALRITTARPTYIETPRSMHRVERIDGILAQRMREFMLSRRQRQWQEKRE